MCKGFQELALWMRFYDLISIFPPFRSLFVFRYFTGMNGSNAKFPSISSNFEIVDVPRITRLRTLFHSLSRRHQTLTILNYFCLDVLNLRNKLVRLKYVRTHLVPRTKNKRITFGNGQLSVSFGQTKSTDVAVFIAIFISSAFYHQFVTTIHRSTMLPSSFLLCSLQQ